MNAPISLFYVVISLIIAYLGRKYRFGFWGYFFSSLLLTPIVGCFLLIASMPAKRSLKDR